MQEHVPDHAAGEHARYGAGADDEEQEARERLVDPILLRRELDPERLDAGEEVVAAGARDDQDDVRPDVQDVARRRNEAQPERVAR